MENNVYYEQGTKEDIAIVLSCPGQKEEKAIPPGPAKGETGNNLNRILEILTTKYDQIGFSREEVLVTNCWDKVEYPDKTGRSEATIIEILEKENLDRLALEIRKITKYIIVCGANAKIAVMMLIYAKKLQKSVKLIFVEHIGNQGLNPSIKYDIDGNRIINYKNATDKPAGENRSIKQISKNNKEKRLEVVAQKIFDQL